MFFLFFSHLGLGLLACLLFLPVARLGRQFFTLNVSIALACLVLGAATRWSRGQTLGADLVACVVLAAAHVVALRGRQRAWPPLLLAAAVVAGSTALAREALRLAALPATPIGAPLLLAHFATSAFLLGAVTLDMILGHHYLVVPNLSFGHLRRMTLVLGTAIALRLGVTVWTLAGSWDAWAQAWRLDATRFLLEHGFFLTLRLLFGILAPAVLVFLVWECVRIRSNQSATGILYVATAVVLIGEIAAKYFLTSAALLL